MTRNRNAFPNQVLSKILRQMTHRALTLLAVPELIWIFLALYFPLQTKMNDCYHYSLELITLSEGIQLHNFVEEGNNVRMRMDEQRFKDPPFPHYSISPRKPQEKINSWPSSHLPTERVGRRINRRIRYG